MADLDEIMSGQGEALPDQTVQQQTEPQPDPAYQQDGTQPQPGEGDEPAQVPLAALKEERGKVKRYSEQVADFEKKLTESNAAWERRFSEMMTRLAPPQPAQQPQQAPDFFEAPDAYLAHQLQPLQQQLVQQREEMSRLMATDKFGEEAVNAAYSDIEGRIRAGDRNAAVELQRIMSTPHPYGSLVTWHKQQATLRDIGTDPDAYKARVRAELLAEMQAGQQQPAPSPQQGGQAPAMPSSFTTAQNSGPRATPQFAGPQPLSAIMKR